MNRHQVVELTEVNCIIDFHPEGEQRSTTNGTPVAANDGVISPGNRMTILPRYALSTTTGITFTVFN